MSKDKLDLDFDDIAGENQTKKAPKKPSTERKTESKSPEKEIHLAIPTQDSNRFISKTITECTDEEFLAWAKFVYPDVGDDPTIYKSRQSRINAIKSIIKFHQSGLSWLGISPDGTIKQDEQVFN